MPSSGPPRPSAGILDLNSTAFSGEASFSFAIFSGQAKFTSMPSSKDITFSPTTFSGKADFFTATFSGPAHFRSGAFSGGDLVQSSGMTDFKSAIFEGPAIFEATIFNHGADFSDGSFAAQTVFKGAQFRQRVPKFYQRVLHQDTSFTTEQNHWPTITAAIAEESKRAYTRLRQLMLELEKPDDAHFFFRQEMRCKAYLEGLFYAVINRLFAFFSNYGHSLGRPVAGLAFLWLIPAMFYYGSGVFFDGTHRIGCYVGWDASPPGCAEATIGAGARALGFSFSNLFPFGLTFLHFGPDFMRSLGPCLQLLAGSQTVLGFVFLFLLGLGLRNRFRLK